MYCYFTCVRDGAIPLAYALQESGLTEPEFMRAMTKTTIKEECLCVLETLIQNKIITEEDAVKMRGRSQNVRRHIRRAAHMERMAQVVY